METTAGEFPRSCMFNHQLFTVNGKSMKFFLYGFGSDEFTDIAKIVEAFGGKLSHPDVPQTLVFAKSGNVFKNPHNYYDVKFLKDSITSRKLQNLQDYRLLSFVNGKVKRFVIDCESRNIHDELQNNGSYNGESKTSENVQNVNYRAPFINQKLKRSIMDRESRYIKNKLRRNSNDKGYSAESDESDYYGNFNLQATRKRTKRASRTRSVVKVEIRQYSESSLAMAKYDVETANNSSKSKNRNGLLKLKSDEISAAPVMKYPSKNVQIDHQTRGHSSKEILNIQKPRKSINQENAQSNYASVDCRTSQNYTEKRFLSDKRHIQHQLNANEEHHSSEGEWSDESFTTLQRRVLDSYKTSSVSGEFTDTTAADYNSLDRLKKKSIRDINIGNESSGIETRCKTMRVELRARNTSRKINKLDLEKYRCNNIDQYCLKVHNKNTEYVNAGKRREFTDDSDTGNTSIEGDNSSSAFSAPHNEFQGDMTLHKAKQPQACDQSATWSPCTSSANVITNRQLPQRRRKDTNRNQTKKQNVHQAQKRKSSKKHQYTLEENRRLIKFLVEQNAIGRGKGIAIWRMFLENETLNDPIPSVKALSSHFADHLQTNYRKYTDDWLAIEQFEKHYPSERTVQSTSSLNAKSTTTSDKRKSRDSVIERDSRTVYGALQKTFNNRKDLKKSKPSNNKKKSSAQSEEPDTNVTARMIEAVPSSDKTERSKVSTIKVSSGTHHTEDGSNQNPRGNEKTSGSDLLLTENMMHSFKTNSSDRWTEEEDQQMIDFLIEKNAIRDAFSLATWEECLHFSPLFQRNGRSASSILSRFKFYLRRNYSKYINNPAILNKFKDIERICTNGTYKRNRMM